MIRNARIYALDTGMRLGEILSLRWRNVDFEDRVTGRKIQRKAA